jgi:hypothetical protein
MLDVPNTDWRRLRQMERNIRWLDLVSFEEMADWYAMAPGSLSRDEGRREQAWRDLLDAAGRGEFGPPDRPTLAYLSPTAMHEGWRTRVRVRSAHICALSPSVVFTTKPLAAAWFTSRQLLSPPWLAGARSVGKPVQTIEGEIAHPTRALNAPPKFLTPAKPIQADITKWMLALYQQAFEAGRPPPKREFEAFPLCRENLNATDTQMRKAMQQVPAEMKRGRGHKDR